MHIICPHCTTSYAIDLATLGAAGRTVRCSRCKEVWLARPEDATDLSAKVPAMAEAGAASVDAAAEWEALERGQNPTIYRSFTKGEIWVPNALVILHGVLALLALAVYFGVISLK